MARRTGIAALPVFFMLVFGFFCIAAPRFASAGNLDDLMAGYAFIAVAAMGQAVVILVRGIDLSIGAIVALAGMVAFDASLVLHWPGWLVLCVAVAVGTLAGFVNGLLVAGLRLQPFIATLSTLAAYRGLVYAISGRQLVPGLSTTAISDPWLTALDAEFDVGTLVGLGDGVGMLPWSFAAMGGLLVLLQAMLSRTRLGRDLLAVGGNPEAARLAGVPVGRRLVLAYACAGFCAGIAALMLVARLTTATEAIGTGLELTTIAAAVIGGVSLSGGAGSLWGPVLGAFLLGVVLMGLTLCGISQFVQQVLTGAILLGAVAHARWLAHRREGRGLAPAPT